MPSIDDGKAATSRIERGIEAIIVVGTGKD